GCRQPAGAGGHAHRCEPGRRPARAGHAAAGGWRAGSRGGDPRRGAGADPARPGAVAGAGRAGLAAARPGRRAQPGAAGHRDRHQRRPALPPALGNPAPGGAGLCRPGPPVGAGGRAFARGTRRVHGGPGAALLSVEPGDAHPLAAASREALSEGGELARNIAAFAPRPSQQDLSAEVAEAIAARGVLMAEAGTGTGKTFAYLVPAILSGRKTIVSTGTRALQDQLYHRDLPRVRDALGRGLKPALLKGRANYLCHYRLDQAKGGGRFASREVAAQFQRVVAWAGRTRMGDMAELEGLPDDSPLLPMVTSTGGHCLGGDCPFFPERLAAPARQRAQAADLVVVNPHLLLADLALRQEGFAAVLPGAEAFIIDEAHQLPELAAQFFGESLSARPLVELARDAIAEAKESPGAVAVLQEPARVLEHATRALRAAMDEPPVRGTRGRAGGLPEVEDALDQLATALETLHAALLPVREAAPGLDGCAARARDFANRLKRWREDGEEEPADAEDIAAQDAPAGDPPDDRGPLVEDGDPSVTWYELTARGFRLSRTPLDVAGPLARHRARSQAAWVFTSATLAIGGRFEHFAIKLGLSKPRTLLAPSPFDWPRQALCYLPPRMPEPSSPGYTEAVVRAVWPVLEASGGRAFLLFASHR